MVRALLCCLAAIAAYGAEDGWNKVKDLKTGTELRIFKTGAKQAVLATMDEANDERIVIVVKNEQMAIDKDQIDRIDYRPPKTGNSSRVTRETRNTVEPPGQTAGPSPRGSTGGPTTSTSSSSNVSFGGSKPDFETIYRRAPVMPPAK